MADEHECDVCGATFDSTERLQAHARQQHDQEE